jgi:hypothetical protein
LWPKNFDTGAENYEPRYRDKPPVRPTTERGPAALAIVELSLSTAGTDPERLAGLIEHLYTAPAAARAQVRNTLQSFATNEPDLAKRLVVWDALREAVNKHRSFATAQWALPEAELADFDPIITALSPNQPSDRYRWLFESDHPQLPLPHGDFAAIDAALADQRAQAIHSIIAVDGIAGVAAFATTVKLPFLVGRIVATSTAGANEEALLGHLGEGDRSLIECGMGYVAERYTTGGIAWVDGVLAHRPDWTTETRVRFLHALPSTRSIWERVEAHGCTQQFWQRTRVYLTAGTTPEDFAYAVTHLLENGQASQALDQVGMFARRTPTGILTQTLDALLQALQGGGQNLNHLLGYHVIQILAELDRRNDIDIGIIARLEWAFLPLLRNERNLRLYEYLAAEPAFFAQMITTLYRPVGDQPALEPSAEEVARAHHAYDLLSSWHTIPGTHQNGTIDAAALQAWIIAAQAECRNHREACDQNIGQVLARAPNGADGFWPHESVRAALEHFNNPAMERGFWTATLNGRGVVTRDPFAGGDQEQTMAQHYRTASQALAPASPRTAAVLADIADHYERDAHRQDIHAAHLRFRF